MAELCEILTPFFRSVIQNYFGEYRDFHEDMMKLAAAAAEAAFYDLDPDNRLEEQLLYGIYRQILFFVKKRARFV